MNKKYGKTIFCLLLLMLLASPLVNAAAQEGSGSLFEPLAADGREAAPSIGETVMRSRTVSINFDVLPGSGSVEAPAQGQTLYLNLFDDASFVAEQEELKVLSPDSYTWAGHLQGVEFSSVILSVVDGVMAANVIYPDGEFQVRYLGDGVHVIYQIDQSKYPQELEPIEVALPDEGLQADTEGDEVSIEGDSANEIDVLVVYDSAAEKAAGGKNGIDTLIHLAIEETNIGYRNSGISQRLYLAHKARVNYDETGFDWSTTLTRLRNDGDGYMDEVHDLRDVYIADEVVMLVADPAYCGLAYMMSTVSSTFESNAFALVNYDCAAGYFSFGHELGHNMGARHDWYVDSNNNSPYAYNHGYSYHGSSASTSFRTVMAYNTQCASWFTGGCNRVNWWSNPEVNYESQATGLGSPCGSSCWSDNQLTLDGTANTVANFRSSSSSSAPSPVGPSGSYINTSMTRLFTYHWSTVPDASLYRLEIRKGDKVVYKANVKSTSTDCTASDCYHTPKSKKGFLGEGTYQWRVIAKVGKLWTAWSSPVSLSYHRNGFSTEYSEKTDKKEWKKVLGGWKIYESDFLVSKGLKEKTASVYFATQPYSSLVNKINYRVNMIRYGDCTGCANAILIHGQPKPLWAKDNWMSGYYFAYTNNGNYAVFRFDGSTESVASLKGWTYSASINVNDWNTLKVVSDGPLLYFYINGSLVWNTTDATYTDGYVGIATYTISTSDNLLIVDWAALSETDMASLDETSGDTIEPGQIEYEGGTPYMDPFGVVEAESEPAESSEPGDDDTQDQEESPAPDPSVSEGEEAAPVEEAAPEEPPVPEEVEPAELAPEELVLPEPTETPMPQ